MSKIISLVLTLSMLASCSMSDDKSNSKNTISNNGSENPNINSSAFNLESYSKTAPSVYINGTWVFTIKSSGIDTIVNTAIDPVTGFNIQTTSVEDFGFSSVSTAQININAVVSSLGYVINSCNDDLVLNYDPINSTLTNNGPSIEGISIEGEISFSSDNNSATGVLHFTHNGELKPDQIFSAVKISNNTLPGFQFDDGTNCFFYLAKGGTSNRTHINLNNGKVSESIQKHISDKLKIDKLGSKTVYTKDTYSDNVSGGAVEESLSLDSGVYKYYDNETDLQGVITNENGTPVMVNNLGFDAGFFKFSGSADANPFFVSVDLKNSGAGEPTIIKDYSKISSTGNLLPDDATLWSCVRDNDTGLIWEEKTNDGGLRDKVWRYTWFDNNTATNGSFAGTPSGGNCFATGRCDTQKYVADVNSVGLCGATDWRMPTVNELKELLTCSYPNCKGTPPYIDQVYFLQNQFYFWSASPYGEDNNEAWIVYFNYGSVQHFSKFNNGYIRLVREGN